MSQEPNGVRMAYAPEENTVHAFARTYPDLNDLTVSTEDPLPLCGTTRSTIPVDASAHAYANVCGVCEAKAGEILGVDLKEVRG